MTFSETQIMILTWILTIGGSLISIAVSASVLYFIYLFVQIVKNFSKKY